MTTRAERCAFIQEVAREFSEMLVARLRRDHDANAPCVGFVLAVEYKDEDVTFSTNFCDGCAIDALTQFLEHVEAGDRLRHAYQVVGHG